jgi:hypothetical protein
MSNIFQCIGFWNCNLILLRNVYVVVIWEPSNDIHLITPLKHLDHNVLAVVTYIALT